MGFFDKAKKEMIKGAMGGSIKVLDDAKNSFESPKSEENKSTTKICTKCGKNVLSAAQTCPYCGSRDFKTKQPTKSFETPKSSDNRGNSKICAKCGKKVFSAVQKCPFCGSRDFKESHEKLWGKQEVEIKAPSSPVTIYRKVEMISKNKNPGTHIRPKGITDIIGGMYGNTAIRKEVTYTPKFSVVGHEWKEDKILFDYNGITISSSGRKILYKQMESISYENAINKDTMNDKDTLRDILSKGFLVCLEYEEVSKLRKGEHYTNSLCFRSLEVDRFAPFLKEKIDNKKTSEEFSKNNVESSTSNADELMKYAELYEKGLLTEEEFTAFKKKLLGL